ncbi:MAG: hypothetical protein R8G66_04735 [Cytophagales bacterium]|nr:hypothetical protein [Cytophagales bacterium]
MSQFLRKRVLKNFLKVDLSQQEEEIFNSSVEGKYCPALVKGTYCAILVIPALLFLDAGIIVSVLIPVTMVAGTAWFSVSLASMKRKFEGFGLELTRSLFSAFVISLLMLLLVTVFSLTRPFWESFINNLPYQFEASLASAGMGIVIVGYLLYQIFLGSLKYDINDAMLTGQNEAAELYFKKALSVLHKTAEGLREHRNLQVANYLIGICFFEIFDRMKLTEEVEKANNLIFLPAMPQQEADVIAMDMIRRFLTLCDLTSDEKEHKPYRAISDELKCLMDNSDENQEMKDIRLSVVFEEMAALMEDKGESLFKKA